MDFAHAVAIAARAHGASRDPSGRLNLARALDVPQALDGSTTPAAMSTAVLYRIPDTTDWTLEHLASLGAEAVICEAIAALTRRRGESYMDYVRRVCATPGTAGETARLVMVAELRFGISETDSDALRERYESSLPLVQRALAPLG